jgi:predicted nucleic acid-binding protein
LTYAYVDASALIKCYVEETGSAVMLREREQTRGWFTSRLTQAECLAALNRLRREGKLTLRDAEAASSALADDLERLHVVDVTAPPLAKACEWARREPLRGADLVHASTALWLRDEGVLSALWCSDRRLGNAAAMLGLEVFDPEALEAGQA